MSPAQLREYLEPAVLRDGESVVIRALRPADKPLLEELFRRLSPESSWLRFFGVKRPLRESELAEMAELDFHTRVGLAAIHREEGQDKIIGVAHFLCCAPQPVGSSRAEFAVTVADEHQGRGIGTLLLEHLALIARANGVQEFEAEVLAENVEMLKVFAESGFAVRQTANGEAFHVVFPTAQTERFLQASIAREQRAAAESVRVFFEPTSVAVVGVSRREGTIGRAVLENLKRCGFRGPIYPVNPAAQEIAGLVCYPSVSAVGARVDLAVITVPAAGVEEVVADCAAAGVRGVVVISSGFAEASVEGRAAQDRLRRLVRSSGLRMVGPNCMGVLNVDPSVSLNATFAATWPAAGSTASASAAADTGTTTSEVGRWLSNRSVTLPTSTRSTQLLPCEPTTSRSAPHPAASRRIVSTARP